MMPQLMPLYWIMSSFFVILLMLLFMKIYGNYNSMSNFLHSMKGLEVEKNMWYW